MFSFPKYRHCLGRQLTAQLRFKMASLHSLITVVFFLLCGLTTSLSQANSRSQGRNKNSTFMRRDIDAKANRMDEAIRSTAYIDDMKVREVLSKNYNSTINIVVLRISVIVGNRTRVCKRMKLYWANEVGLTILTVSRRAKDTIFTSPFFTMILDVGTETVDIQTKVKRCPTSEQIFDSILHELSHNDGTHSFQICKTHRIKTTHHTTYNCCRLVGPKNFPFCADYSSPIVDFATPVVAVMFCICCLMVVPFLLQYIATYPKTKFYKMSDSPMSLGSIASGILFEGRGPFKSLFRRGAFVGISYFVVFYEDFYGMEWLKCFYWTWAGFFMFFNDTRMTAKGDKEGEKCEQPRANCECERKCNDWIAKCEECFPDQLQLDVKMLSCFTIPLCVLHGIPTWFASEIKRYDERIGSKVKDTSNLRRVLYEFVHNLFSVVAGIVLGIVTVLSLLGYIIFVAWHLLVFFLIDLLASFIWPCQRGIYILKLILLFPRLLTLVMSAFLTCMIFISVLFLVVSIALNAEFFSPYIAPILAVILYFIKNWRWSVEGKCVQLKMLIIDVSKVEEGLDDEIQNSDISRKNKSTGEDCFLKLISPCLPYPWFKCSCLSRDRNADHDNWCSRICPCLSRDRNPEEDNSSLVNAGQNSSIANADQGNWCSRICPCLSRDRNPEEDNSSLVNAGQNGTTENVDQDNSSLVNAGQNSSTANADQGNWCSRICPCLSRDRNPEEDNSSLVNAGQNGTTENVDQDNSSLVNAGQNSSTANADQGNWCSRICPCLSRDRNPEEDNSSLVNAGQNGTTENVDQDNSSLVNAGQNSSTANADQGNWCSRICPCLSRDRNPEEDNSSLVNAGQNGTTENVDQDNSSLVNAGQNSSTANADQGNWCSRICPCLSRDRNPEEDNSSLVNAGQNGTRENVDQDNSSLVNAGQNSSTANADQGNWCSRICPCLSRDRNPEEDNSSLVNAGQNGTTENVDQDNSSLVNAGQNSSTANTDQGNWCSRIFPCLSRDRNPEEDNSSLVNAGQNGTTENVDQDNSSLVNAGQNGTTANVDQDNSSLVNAGQNSSTANADQGNWCLRCNRSEDQDNNEKPIIKIDQCGEAMISKELYETIIQSVLPLDRLLFYFFRRMIFVGLYSVCILVIMTVAQKSGVSGSVQIISGILGILIPFVFDSIFAEHYLSQRTSQEKAIRQKLQHILKTTRLNKNTVLVELVNINDNVSPAKSLNALCQKMTPRVVSFIALCKRIEAVQPLSEEKSQESSTINQALQLLLKENSPESSVDPLKQVSLNAVSLDKLYQQITPTIESCLAIIQEIAPLVDSLPNMFRQNSLPPNLHKQIRSTVASLVKTSEWITSTVDSFVAKSKEITSSAEKLFPSQDAEFFNKWFPNNAADSTDSYNESCEQLATSISSLVAEIQKVSPVAEQLKNSAKSLKKSAESLNMSATSPPPAKTEEVV